MRFEMYRADDVVRFRANTIEAAEVDYSTGTVLRVRTDIPLCGHWVDVDFQGIKKIGVATGRLELVRRAPKDLYNSRFTEDHEAVDRERDWRRQQ